MDGAQKEISASYFVEEGQVHLSKLSCNVQIDYKEMYEARELCYELKLLYTAVTRTRNSLLIYDEVGVNRKHLERFWEKLNVVDNT